jgi:hypothetical protein
MSTENWLIRNIMPVLAIVVVVLGIGYLFGEALGMKLTQASAVVGLMMAVVGFYFGSSEGSRIKDMKGGTKDDTLS